MQAEDYQNKKIKTKVNRIDAENKSNIDWDFSSGDHSEMVKMIKKKSEEPSKQSAFISKAKIEKQPDKKGDEDLFDDLCE